MPTNAELEQQIRALRAEVAELRAVITKDIPTPHPADGMTSRDIAKIVLTTPNDSGSAPVFEPVLSPKAVVALAAELGIHIPKTAAEYSQICNDAVKAANGEGQ